MNFNNTYNSFRWLCVLSGLIYIAGCSNSRDEENAQSINRLPHIQPDYSGITLPCNIAPINFSIKEIGLDYDVRIQSHHGTPIRIQNTTGNIKIDEEDWKQLLVQNIGEDLTIDISIKNQSGQWSRFGAIRNHIAQEPLDGYLTYRKFKPIFNTYATMGIFQRCLENFDVKPILLNRLTNNGCMNCHNFWQNGTDRWLLHLRGGSGTAMLLTIDGQVRKIDTKTKFNGPVAYPAWHPSGTMIAFSVSNLILFYHETGECRDVLDKKSDIVLYDIQTNTITTTPQISNPYRYEIWPAWSPDGKYLYFCSAPQPETPVDPSSHSDFAYDKIKYDLMRVAYDPAAHTWGKLETVISASDIGLSITEPRVSPDGRFVLFTAAEYSQFPIYLRSADLYLLDVKTNKWKKLEINSDRADSFHSWSSNGRWCVFSTKRMDGLMTTPFFSHIDSLGNTSKPFVLPQEDPLFYETNLEVFNVPELTKEPVHTSMQALVTAACSEQDALTAHLDPDVFLTRDYSKPGSAASSTPSIKQRKEK
jgi:hypothetical protein